MDDRTIKMMEILQQRCEQNGEVVSLANVAPAEESSTREFVARSAMRCRLHVLMVYRPQLRKLYFTTFRNIEKFNKMVNGE